MRLRTAGPGTAGLSKGPLPPPAQGHDLSPSDPGTGRGPVQGYAGKGAGGYAPVLRNASATPRMALAPPTSVSQATLSPATGPPGCAGRCQEKHCLTLTL